MMNIMVKENYIIQMEIIMKVNLNMGKNLEMVMNIIKMAKLKTKKFWKMMLFQIKNIILM